MPYCLNLPLMQFQHHLTRELATGSSQRAKRKCKRTKRLELLEPLLLRINGLWEELHIPRADREYFHEAYCRTAGKKDGLSIEEAIVEVCCQIKLLVKHREMTLAVLHAINQREAHLLALMQ
ncbi:unnamed protein product, partial [Chrysoparadoxa australica]